MEVSRPRPMYVQIADELRRLIRSGRLAVGAVLEPEPILATRYGTSRVTVNRAVQILRGEGLVEVRRGHQTVVIGDHVAVTVRLSPKAYESARRAAHEAGEPVEEWAAARLAESAGHGDAP